VKIRLLFVLLLAGFAVLGSLWIAHRRNAAEATSSVSTTTAIRPRPTAGPAGVEKEMFDLVNADRANPAYSVETHGLALPLVWNPALAEVARAHSCDMMKRGFFAHENPDGLLPRQRIEKAGIAWHSLAENIAKDATVADAEAAFMSEPPSQANHRGNILNPQLTNIGIGVCSGQGYLWITQDFRTP
jgi:uncharacterized protein YkwD